MPTNLPIPLTPSLWQTKWFPILSCPSAWRRPVLFHPLSTLWPLQTAVMTPWSCCRHCKQNSKTRYRQQRQQSFLEQQQHIFQNQIMLDEKIQKLLELIQCHQYLHNSTVFEWKDIADEIYLCTAIYQHFFTIYCTPKTTGTPWYPGNVTQWMTAHNHILTMIEKYMSPPHSTHLWVDDTSVINTSMLSTAPTKPPYGHHRHMDRTHTMAKLPFLSRPTISYCPPWPPPTHSMNRYSINADLLSLQSLYQFHMHQPNPPQ